MGGKSRIVKGNCVLTFENGRIENVKTWVPNVEFYNLQNADRFVQPIRQLHC